MISTDKWFNDVQCVKNAPKVLDKEFVIPKNYQDLLNYNYNVKQLNKIIGAYNLQINKQLTKQKKLIKMYNVMRLNRYANKIISYFRYFFQIKRLCKLQNPYNYSAKDSVNDTDFLLLTDICDIPQHRQFFIREKQHITKNNYRVFIFDSNTLNELFTHGKPTNPYTNNLFHDSIRTRLRRHTRLLKNMKINLPKKTKDRAENQCPVDYCSQVFGVISSELEFYVDKNWLLMQPLENLIVFLETLQDMWEYRLDLSAEEKETIIPNHANLFKNMFRHMSEASSSQIFDVTTRECIKIIDKFVNSAHDINDRKNGAMYVIAALTTVSLSARREYETLSEILI